MLLPACPGARRGVAGDARARADSAVGADADIVVLDPAANQRRATYVDLPRPSVGIRHLLVDGTFVVRDGQLQPGRDARPTGPWRTCLAVPQTAYAASCPQGAVLRVLRPSRSAPGR